MEKALGLECLSYLCEYGVQGLKINVIQVTGEVLLDAAVVYGPGLTEHALALLGEDGVGPAAVFHGMFPADQPRLLHAVDEAGEAAAAQYYRVGQPLHPESPFGGFMELDPGAFKWLLVIGAPAASFVLPWVVLKPPGRLENPLLDFGFLLTIVTVIGFSCHLYMPLRSALEEPLLWLLT